MKLKFDSNLEYQLEAIRSVSRYLGIKRLSKPIQDELKSYIRTAIRRKIIVRNGDGFNLGTPTIDHYGHLRNFLINEVAKNLGFDRVSKALSERMKSIFRVTIRQGQL